MSLPRPYYQDEAVTLYHGDNRAMAQHLSADLIVTDPPYGLSSPGSASVGPNGSRSLDFFQNDTLEDGYEHVRWLVLHLLPVVQPVGGLYAWLGHQQFGQAVMHLEAAGWRTRFLVWARECPVPPSPGSGWPSAASLCVYGYKSGRTWNYDGTTMPPSNVIWEDAYRHGQIGKNGHPTQMREELVARPILASSRPGGVILDPFAGSGTTLRVAKDLGRKAIGIEINERWCALAARRCAQEVMPL